MSDNKVMTEKEVNEQYQKDVTDSKSYGDEIRAQVRRDTALEKLRSK